WPVGRFPCAARESAPTSGHRPGLGGRAEHPARRACRWGPRRAPVVGRQSPWLAAGAAPACRDPLSAGALGRPALGGPAAAVGEGLDDFRGLRPYQPADGRRRLDWKAYARGQGLRVKDFAAQAGDRCLLDLAQLAGPLEERLANLCAGVLRFSEQGVTFELRLATERLGPAIGRAHRDACLRALALYGLEDEA